MATKTPTTKKTNTVVKSAKPAPKPVVTPKVAPKPATPVSSRQTTGFRIQPVIQNGAEKKAQARAQAPVTTPTATPAPRPTTYNTSPTRRTTSVATANQVTPPATAPTPVLQKDRRAPVVQDLAREQQALGEALQGTEFGGANQGYPAGTDIPKVLDENPSFRKLLQEQIYSRAYGTGAPKFTTPTPTPTTLAPAQQPESLMPGEGDLFGLGTDGFDVNSLFSRFGVTNRQAALPAEGTDTTLAPGSEYDTQLSELADQSFDTAAAQRAYDLQLQAIRDRFNQERQQRTRDVENQSAERFSNLAGVGFNPLSSGGLSEGNASRELLNRFMSDISQRQSAEEANAASQFAATRDAAVAGRMKFLQDERANRASREETTYQRGRNSVNDSINVLNAVLNAVEKNRSISNTERDNTVNGFKTILDELGSTAFDGLADADLRAFEKALGMPSGSMRGALASFKSAELKAAQDKNKPELREVGGSLYQMVYDAETGRWTPTILIQKPVTAGSGGGSGRGRAVSVNGGSVSDADYNLARAAYSQAYADTASSWVNLSDEDKDDIVSNFIYLGGSATNNPFLTSRRSAEAEFGSQGGSSYKDFLTPSAPASTGGGASTPAGPPAPPAWSSYGISDPFAGL